MKKLSLLIVTLATFAAMTAAAYECSIYGYGTNCIICGRTTVITYTNLADMEQPWFLVPPELNNYLFGPVIPQSVFTVHFRSNCVYHAPYGYKPAHGGGQINRSIPPEGSSTCGPNVAPQKAAWVKFVVNATCPDGGPSCSLSFDYLSRGSYPFHSFTRYSQGLRVNIGETIGDDVEHEHGNILDTGEICNNAVVALTASYATNIQEAVAQVSFQQEGVGGFTNSAVTIYLPAYAIGGIYSISNGNVAVITAVTNQETIGYCTKLNTGTPATVCAFDAFVTSLKSAGVWTKLFALWPLYGVNHHQTALDLKSGAANYNILWYGNLKNNDSLHTLSGVTGTTNTQSYGNLLYKPYDFGASPTNFHMMVWSKTADPNPNYKAAMGVYGNYPYSPVTSHSEIWLGGAYSYIFGIPCRADGYGEWGYNTNNQTGFFLVQDGGGAFNGNSLTQLQSANLASEFARGAIFLFGLHADNWTDAANSDITLAGASIGQKLTSTELSNYRQAWSNLQSALGR